MPTQDFVGTTSEELHDRIGRAHDRCADLLAGAPQDLRVGSWTSAEVAGHLVTVVNRYTSHDPSRLARTPRDVDRLNAEELVTVASRSVSDLLRQLSDEMTSFRALWRPACPLPLDTPMPFHGGATIDLQSALTNLLGEFLIHGHDVALAAHRDWRIDERDALLLCGLGTQLAPTYLSAADGDRLVHVQVPGLGAWALGTVEGTPVSRRPLAGDHPDVVLTGPASGVALFVYGRLDPSQFENHAVQVVGDAAVLATLLQDP